MRILTDEARIARGARLGKFLTFGALGLLLVGLILSMRMGERSLLWLLATLALGMVAASVGLVQMNRWVRQPRADQALEQGLKGFDDHYRLYNYCLPAPHVLLGPSGLSVLTAVGQDGTIHFDGTKFRRNLSVGRILRFLGDEGIGRPFAEGDTQVEALRRYLEKRGVAGDLPIQNVIVFYHPRAALTVNDPPRPVVVPKGLKRVVRRPPEQKLQPAVYQQLLEAFEGRADGLS